MADYYTHFSCLLDVGTPENAARALDLYNALAHDNAAEDPPSDGFLLSIQPEHGGTQLWIRDDVTGDPEHVVQRIVGFPVRKQLLETAHRRIWWWGACP
jgi:hypothetical protein